MGAAMTTNFILTVSSSPETRPTEVIEQPRTIWVLTSFRDDPAEHQVYWARVKSMVDSIRAYLKKSKGYTVPAVIENATAEQFVEKVNDPNAAVVMWAGHGLAGGKLAVNGRDSRTQFFAHPSIANLVVEETDLGEGWGHVLDEQGRKQTKYGESHKDQVPHVVSPGPHLRFVLFLACQTDAKDEASAKILEHPESGPKYFPSNEAELTVDKRKELTELRAPLIGGLDRWRAVLNNGRGPTSPQVEVLGSPTVPESGTLLYTLNPKARHTRRARTLSEPLSDGRTIIWDAGPPEFEDLWNRMELRNRHGSTPP